MQNDATSETEQAEPIGFVGWTVLLLLAGAVVGSLILFYVYRDTFIAKSDGMAPTIQTGDRVHVDRNAACCRRGDIVIFDAERAPGWEGLEHSHRLSRVIGLPGDTVSWCADVRVCVNGDVLSEPYLRRGTITTFPKQLASRCEPDSPALGCRLPPGTMFVLGDNRRVALDSRRNGPVSLDAVIGVID